MILIPLEVKVVKLEPVDPHAIDYESMGLIPPLSPALEEKWQVRYYSKAWLELEIASIHADNEVTVVEFLDQTTITVNEFLVNIIKKLTDDTKDV